MSAYYNEFDPFAAAWLRELIKAGHIAAGEVDERSIIEVRPEDLRGFDQCHFFAGIGGWSYALRLARWPDTRPVWTGSCPCQPFSAAGKGAVTSDPRHLWPAFFQLIEQCRPPVVVGEQVAGADGRAWLDLVYTDLEGSAYRVGAANLCAAGVGAPHIRQRLYWVADAHIKRHEIGAWQPRDDGVASEPTAGKAVVKAGLTVWSAADWLPCRDDKARPVEPGTFPLAHGVPARVGRLRGYGNAIVPQVAAEFITAYLAATDTTSGG